MVPRDPLTTFVKCLVAEDCNSCCGERTRDSQGPVSNSPSRRALSLCICVMLNSRISL
uniref:Uncharacterized protein n=1 Tax=Octopus bimaculoides TaxID=37653 RepID=A0A0L8I7Y5_OCTBM